MQGIETSKKVLVLAGLQAIFVVVAGLFVVLAYFESAGHNNLAEQHVQHEISSTYFIIALVLIGAAFLSIVAGTIPLMRKNKGETEDISNLAKSYEKQAVTDALTELPNRRYFEKAFEAYLNEFNAIGKSLGLLVLDLDHFKSVNDNYGHDIGDLVLREVALRLHGITRKHDIVARLGGEEFAVITPYAEYDQLLSIAERYRASIESLKVDIGSVILRPTVSIGVATNSSSDIDIHEMFKQADHKLYEAKRSGRNRVAA